MSQGCISSSATRIRNLGPPPEIKGRHSKPGPVALNECHRAEHAGDRKQDPPPGGSLHPHAVRHHYEDREQALRKREPERQRGDRPLTKQAYGRDEKRKNTYIPARRVPPDAATSPAIC